MAEWEGGWVGESPGVPVVPACVYRCCWLGKKGVGSGVGAAGRTCTCARRLESVAVGRLAADERVLLRQTRKKKKEESIKNCWPRVTRGITAPSPCPNQSPIGTCTSTAPKEHPPVPFCTPPQALQALYTRLWERSTHSIRAGVTDGWVLYIHITGGNAGYRPPPPLPFPRAHCSGGTNVTARAAADEPGWHPRKATFVTPPRPRLTYRPPRKMTSLTSCLRGRGSYTSDAAMP